MCIIYYTYLIKNNEISTTFQQVDKILIAGCNNGIIPNYLKKVLLKENTEPYGWEINIEDLFKILQLNGNSLIMDLKPNDPQNVSLYKIEKIIGFSSYDWTPILLELKEVLVDESSNNYNKKSFSLTNFPKETVIYTFLYLNGSIKNGQIYGKWTFSSPSSTNSVLLWPDALSFFKSKSQI